MLAVEFDSELDSPEPGALPHGRGPRQLRIHKSSGRMFMYDLYWKTF